jgi:NAD binding domain of 6-phosphogluconate dehydrogenase
MADRMPVAVLGARGTMGQAMARNLARAGMQVRAWNRTRDKAAALAQDGITVTETAAEAAGAGVPPGARRQGRGPGRGTGGPARPGPAADPDAPAAAGRGRRAARRPGPERDLPHQRAPAAARAILMAGPRAGAADDLADARRRPVSAQPPSVLSGLTIRSVRREKDT